MKYRSRMDIAAAILATAKDGTMKTHIMYRAFLSVTQLNEYLALLLGSELLEYNREDRMYATTEKGEKFLQMYWAIDSMIPKENMLTNIENVRA